MTKYTTYRDLLNYMQKKNSWNAQLRRETQKLLRERHKEFEKEQKRKNAMLAEMAVGDTVLTTSGFYGILIDVSEDTVIVEFGNNKNCRIPMQKACIAEVEKAGTPAPTSES